MKGAEGGSWLTSLVLRRRQESLHALPLLRRRLVPANSSSSAMCGTGTAPAQPADLIPAALSSAPRLELHCTVLPRPDTDQIYKDLLSQLVLKHGDTCFMRNKRQRKPKAGLRPSLCACGAGASRALRSPGAGGRCSAALGGGRSRSPIPAAPAVAGLGAPGAGCAWGNMAGPWCEE